MKNKETLELKSNDMSHSSPEGIELSKGSNLESFSLSINKEKVLELKQQERMYSEDDMIMFADFFHNYKELLKKEKWEILELSKKDILKKWFEKLKKK